MTYYRKLKAPVFTDDYFDQTQNLLQKEFGKDPFFQEVDFTKNWERRATKEISIFKREGMDHDILTFSEDGHWMCLREDGKTRESIFKSRHCLSIKLELLMSHLMYKGVIPEGTYLLTFDW